MAGNLLLHSNSLFGHSAPLFILGSIELGKGGWIIRRRIDGVASENLPSIGLLQALDHCHVDLADDLVWNARGPESANQASVGISG